MWDRAVIPNEDFTVNLFFFSSQQCYSELHCWSASENYTLNTFVLLLMILSVEDMMVCNNSASCDTKH